MDNNSRISWLNLTANGNVAPSRVVVGVSGAGNGKLAVQASTNGTLPPLGVSQASRRFPPGDPADDGYTAIAGESLPILGPGDMGLVTAGAAITDTSMPLTYDNQGRAITAAPAAGTNVWCFGWPTFTVTAAGQLVEVAITFPFVFQG